MIRCHDLPFKIDIISTNFPRGILTSNRWRIDEGVPIGKFSFNIQDPQIQYTIEYENERK